MTVNVEVLYFEDCPNAAAVRELVRRCAAQFGSAVTIVEREGDWPSPSVRVNGRDLIGDPGAAGRACRCDLPTEDRVMNALRAAVGEVRR